MTLLRHRDTPKPALTSHRAELDNKVIGVIGAGSSAIQIVPQLQAKPGSKLKCFVRSKTWISPPFGAETQHKLGMEGLDCKLLMSSLVR